MMYVARRYVRSIWLIAASVVLFDVATCGCGGSGPRPDIESQDAQNG